MGPGKVQHAVIKKDETVNQNETNMMINSRAASEDETQLVEITRDAQLIYQVTNERRSSQHLANRLNQK